MKKTTYNLIMYYISDIKYNIKKIQKENRMSEENKDTLFKDVNMSCDIIYKLINE
tara:strand:+ start:916 stop:1080 length:165 start_codon:yes stop_codon:yes gene_type:complete